MPTIIQQYLVRQMTDRMIQRIVDNMVIVVDTREKKNSHITDYFKLNKIRYISSKLDTGDYSIILPDHLDLGLNYKFLVERKNSLDEIAGNFTKNRDRFAREFKRLDNQKMHIVIEQATWKKLLKGTYRSKITPKSFTGSLITYCIRYNCPVWFTQTENSGEVIYNLLRYELLEHLKGARDDKGTL